MAPGRNSAQEAQMEVSTSTNVSQSLALAAYTSQQQTVERPRNRDNDTQSVDQNRTSDARQRSDVAFSPEALRLGSQSAQPTENRNTVNRANESAATDRQQQQQAAQAARPELARGAGADTVAQAINAYRSTSVI